MATVEARSEQHILRFARSLTGGLTIALTLTGVAGAHVGERIFPIWEIPTSDLPDLHDGTLEDWEEVMLGSSLEDIDFRSQAGDGGGVDRADLAWRVFLAWHSASQRIYVAIERLDDIFIPSEGPEATVFMLDGDHSGGQYMNFPEDAFNEEERKRINQAQAQSYTATPDPLVGRHLSHPGAAQSWVTSSPWADVGVFQFGEVPNLSAVEFAVTPWDDLNWEGPALSRRSVLEAGKIIGFQILLYDVDKPNRLQGLYAIAVRSIGVADAFAENFVDGELIPCGRGDCSRALGTAVQVDSWGRIKASFR